MEEQLGQEVLQRLERLRTDMSVQIVEKMATALAELKAVSAQEIAEKMKSGFVDPETREKINRIESMYSNLEKEVFRPAGAKSGFDSPEAKSTFDQVTEDAEFKKWKDGGFMVHERGRRGVSIRVNGLPINPYGIATKSIISLGGLGSATSGVVNFDRLPGILQLPRQALRIRDLMTILPTTASQIDFLKQNVFTNSASPQTEGSAKAESTITYNTGTSVVRTIAHWAQITRQALDDIVGLRADIDDTLMYGLKVKEESEILAGDNLGSHLNGLITQGTAYDSGTYNVAGDTKIDKLRHYILQARLALLPPDGIVLNPRDVHDIDLVKDLAGGGSANTGRYIIGDPKSGPEIKMIWGVPVVESDSITYGQTLVGAFRTGARLYDRQQAVLDISFETGSNFTENEATIRCEERVALVCLRPAAFIQGAI